VTQVPDFRPFFGLRSAQVVLPDRTGDPFNPVDAFCRLVEAESAELEAELGCPVAFDPAGSEPHPARCLVGPASINPSLRAEYVALGRDAASEPVVVVDRARRLVILDGPTIADIGTAFQILRTAIRDGMEETRLALPEGPLGILDFLSREVVETYPSFALRGIDWDALVAAHRPGIFAADASLPSLQRLLAGLHDAHTWVRNTATNARLPYRAWIDPAGAHLVHVPTWSAGWGAGARAGDALLDVDGAGWWGRTAAVPRARALVTGYRYLAGTVGETRTLRARIAKGQVIEWSETFQPLPWVDPISWKVLPSGTGYLRVRGWMYTAGWIAALDTAFARLDGCPRLIVDLRGNVGGQLIAAQHFRDRFLDGETHLGSIRFSIGDGRLGEPSPIVGSPPPDASLWHKPVRFVIDRQTYSASEDAVLGLGGLPHVQVVGEPSGGGSGRARTIWLRDDVYATVSTALTFDRNGHCVEANGIPVDIALPVEATLREPRIFPACGILAAADAGWP